MRIYTRQGDKGMTRLADATRIAKNHQRVASYGDIDELNSHIGLLAAKIADLHPELLADLTLIQQELFDLGGELAFSSEAQSSAIWQVNEGWTARLESQIDHYSAQLPPLRQFILPGGSEAAAQAHVVRTLTRRCERQLLTLSEQEQINPAVIPYINRLSDWFFTLARFVLRQEGRAEVCWVKAADR
ncbi:cob(I)yrinic acid a,c-diamide adenosyltransferase [Aeromonas crassostreae]